MPIAGSNAYPSLSFTVAGGNTQTVCVPIQLEAAVANMKGALTNVTILLDGSFVKLVAAGVRRLFHFNAENGAD